MLLFASVFLLTLDVWLLYDLRRDGVADVTPVWLSVHPHMSHRNGLLRHSCRGDHLGKLVAGTYDKHQRPAVQHGGGQLDRQNQSTNRRSRES